MNTAVEEQLERVVEQLKARGVRSMTFYRDHIVPYNREKLAKDMLDILNAYEEGNYKSFKFNDSVRLKDGSVVNLN